MLDLVTAEDRNRWSRLRFKVLVRLQADLDAGRWAGDPELRVAMVARASTGWRRFWADHRRDGRTCELCGVHLRAHARRFCTSCGLVARRRARFHLVESLPCARVGCPRSVAVHRRPGRPRRFCSDRCRYWATGLRYARRQRAAGGILAPLAEVYERDDGLCWVCGEPCIWHHADHGRRPTRDHVVPLARGGTNAPSNVRLAHRSCNSARRP